MARASATPSAWWGAVAALATGMAVWALVLPFSRRHNPIDDGTYTVVWLLSTALCALVGWWQPKRPLRAALLVFQGPLLAQSLHDGTPGNLWPIAMVIFGVVAIPGMLAAWLAARRRRARDAGDW